MKSICFTTMLAKLSSMRRIKRSALGPFCASITLANNNLPRVSKKEYDYLELFEVPCNRRQTPVLPQCSASTDLLFVEPDDILEDIAGTLIFKPDAPSSATPEANPEAKAASPNPASASTIARSASPNSSNSE